MSTSSFGRVCACFRPRFPRTRRGDDSSATTQNRALLAASRPTGMPRASAEAQKSGAAKKVSHSSALQLAAELNAAASALNNAPRLLDILSTSQDAVRLVRCLLLCRVCFRQASESEERVVPERVSSRRRGALRLLRRQAASRTVFASWGRGSGVCRVDAARLVRQPQRSRASAAGLTPLRLQAA